MRQRLSPTQVRSPPARLSVTPRCSRRTATQFRPDKATSAAAQGLLPIRRPGNETVARLRQELDTRGDFESAAANSRSRSTRRATNFRRLLPDRRDRTALAEATAQAAAAERASDTARRPRNHCAATWEPERVEARAERDVLRATHAEQLAIPAQRRRSCDGADRALAAAREMVRLLIPPRPPTPMSNDWQR